MHGIDFTPHIEKLKSWEEVFKERAMKDRREHIATAALQGMLAGLCADPRVATVSSNQVATDAVKFADALIAELDKDQK